LFDHSDADESLEEVLENMKGNEALQILNSLTRLDGEDVLFAQMGRCMSTSLSFIFTDVHMKIERFDYRAYPPPYYDGTLFDV
jgi:hypothetical protein